MNDREYTKGELNPAIQRYIKELEQTLNRKCRRIWSFTNPKEEQYLFGSFCRKWNRMFVTIGNYNQAVDGTFIPAR